MRSFLLVLGFVAVPFASACGAFTGVDSDGLVVTGDGGADDDSGRSTRDSGTSRDGGSKTDSGGGAVEPSLGPECTALQSCCDFLDTTSAATCRSTALDANESSCSANLSAYQADGVCGSVSPILDSGTGGTGPTPTIDAGSPLTANCTQLASCCAGDPTCLGIAAADDDSNCELQLFSMIEDGTCATLP